MPQFNALMDPMQLGQSVQNAFAMGQQQRRQMETDRALSDYAREMNPENAARVTQHDPRLGIQLVQMEQQRQAQEAQQGRQKLQELAKLARGVRDEPTYQRALQIAAQLGIDTTGAPPTYDPNWVAEQAQVYSFFASDQGQEALSSAGKQAMDMGYRPGTPAYTQVVKTLIEASLAQPYVGSEGETRVYTPQLSVAPPPQAPAPQAVAARGPLAGQVLPFEAYVGFLRSVGPAEANEWLKRGQAIAVQTEQEFQQLPPGTPVVFPDGTQGVR